MKTVPLEPRFGPPAKPPASGRAAAFVRLVSVPHRLFFVLAMTLLALTALVWLWAIAARTAFVPPPPLASAQPVWHALAMLYTFLPFYMFGFLFTAGPKWLDVAPPRPRAWLPLASIAFAGTVAMLLSPSASLAQVGAAMLGVSWLALDIVFARLILRSTARDRVHATLVLLAMLAGASAPLAFAVEGAGAYRWLVFAGIWLFAVPMFVIVCHRMIPYFTAHVLPGVAVFRPWWLLALLLAGPIAHGAIAASGLAAWSWLVDLPLALFAFELARRWGLAQSLANRLLAMLHVGFVWYAIAFALFGAASVLEALGRPERLGTAAVHALGIGFCGSLMVAMVSRVTFGHSGRTLAADRLTWALFLLLQAAVAARIGAALWPHPALLTVTAALWAACVVPWSARNLPIYWRARADGRPG